MAKVRAYVGLGGNVGDVPVTLAAAVGALAALPGTRLRGVSRLYSTRPVGVADQPDFCNAVVALDAPGGRDAETGALALLIALKGLEVAIGRRRRQRWGPRELDLDLLLFGRHRVHVERPRTARSTDRVGEEARWLVVPHPAAHERLFVLEPLADLAPCLAPPGWGATVATQRDRRRAVDGKGAVRVVTEWDAVALRWRPGTATTG